MRDEENINYNNNSAGTQRAVPFGDNVNDINEAVDNNNNNNNDDNHDYNPSTVPGDNTIPVDEEAGSNVNSSEQNTVMRPEIIDDDDCPVPFNSAQYEDPDVTMRKIHGKKPEIIDDDDDDDAPLPPSQISALYELMVDFNEGTDKKLMEKLEAEQTTNQTHHEPITEDEEVNMRMVNAKIGRENNDDVGRLSEVASSQSSQSSQQLIQISAPTASPSSGHHQQSAPAIIRRPPPPSMLVDPHGEDDEEGAVTNPAVALQTDDSTRSVRIIEATLVPEEQVYDATPIQDEDEVGSKEEESSWWKRYPKILVLVLVLIVGLAATIGILVSRNEGDSSNGGGETESTKPNEEATTETDEPTPQPPTPQPSSKPTMKCFADRDELYSAVGSYINSNCANNSNCIVGQTYGWPMNSWCVGNVTDMSHLFFGLFFGMEDFNEDISGWNTSSVMTMEGMFQSATSFNGNLSAWNTSSVTNMDRMFRDATSFNGDLSSWNTKSVTDMWQMFFGATSFNGDLSSWNTSNVTNMKYMFGEATSFNSDLSAWDTKGVTNMANMFSDATLFNGNISAWNTSSVEDMWGIFWGATSFNGDLSSWDISSVTSMQHMFEDATSFNQDLCAWGDAFPYDWAYDIFANSGCNNTSTPQEDQKGPFCASDCGKPTTLEPTPVPEIYSACTDTPNYLDTWGGGCADYELPGNEAWCEGYGNMGEEGNTPNENCCVCKALVVDLLPATTSALVPTSTPTTRQLELGSAFVFLRRDGASSFGEVGACFEDLQGRFVCFSRLPTARRSAFEVLTEDYLRGLGVVNDKGFWSETVLDADAALDLFKEGGALKGSPYTDWKRLDVYNVDPNRAMSRMKTVAGMPYSIINRNCVNDVYDILHDEGSGYGITANMYDKNNGCYIGWVQGSFFGGPNKWFDANIQATASGIFPRGEGESCNGMTSEYCAGGLTCCGGTCKEKVNKRRCVGGLWPCFDNWTCP